MSKKKFIDGLEDLFETAGNDTMQDDSPFLTTTVIVGDKKTKTRRHTGKSFTSDLESLFTNSVSEAADQKTSQQEQSAAGNARSMRLRSNSASGLDALIRQTITSSRVDIETSTTKRVTFIFDKRKLGKLKTIAKKERAYLKDIIGEVIADYIREYEQANGKMLSETSA